MTKNLRASAYNNRGSAWFGKGDFDRAIADYNESIRLAPKWALPYNNRGVAWNGKGEFDRAIADYDASLALLAARGSGGAEFYFGRGIAYARLGRADLAEPDFRRAVALEPDIEARMAKIGLTR